MPNSTRQNPACFLNVYFIWSNDLSDGVHWRVGLRVRLALVAIHVLVMMPIA